MANRKLPFGYCLRNGQVQEETTEAELVRLIFRRYGEGASYGTLADELSALGCAYAPGRPWNKNMVARILQDGRYLGNAEYPPLLPPELFHQAQSARPDVSGRLERPEIKDIRVLARCAQCGEPMRRMRKNYWYCSNCMASPGKIKDEALILCVEHLLRSLRGHPETIAPVPATEGEMASPGKIKDEALILCVEHLLRSLREHPETISPVPTAEDKNEAVQTAQDHLARELEQAEFDEAAAKAQVIALASARFNTLGSGDYETMRLRHLLDSAKPCDNLDTALLRQVAVAVLIHPSGAVSLKLKNGQTVEG